ncbi:unnamed protein product [Rangifer tarandus platyrhynchus]|uniref:WD repeat domain 87 n=1 Tax=Rangifer tarandus platyrhynchus TaxID=3082113 RepID=A0ABN8YKT0_RANTA|nr:unnamed protein product [Rangifer tarandus platyrhynchus]
MSFKCWDITRTSTSPRLIPKWKDLKPLLKDILKDKQVDEKTEGDVNMLSDWAEILCQESHHPESKTFICFYSIDDNYFVSLNWAELYSKQMQAVLWIQKKAAEMEGVIKKIKFHVMAQVPPIQAMVHTGPSHMLIAYCDDMRLWLFGDHHQGFISLGMVPCRFSISCLSYDSETEMLLSGTLGAVVTWFILPNGRGLQMAQTVPMPGGELVQGFSLNAPRGSLLAHCENKVRVFTHQGQGQLEEVKKFTPINSGSTITCSFTCLSQGYFYVGNKDGEIHAWGLDRGNFLHSFQAHSSSVMCIQSRSETYTLLTAGSEGVVKEWNLAFGNLLRQLDIDKNMQRLQFIDNSTFFCQTNHTVSLYHLPYFYSLFNICGSAPQEVRRVCCGHNWTRILCATKDGLLRFLSPVTGDLLVITWPLLIMDKAVAWAYDSHREELFVATDSSEVLVFDATRSPCTAKYLMCPSVSLGDRVKCLAYGQYHLGKGLVGLMFSGHDSGTVRILSHYSCARAEKILHSGAVLVLSTLEGPQEYSLLCSYGMDNTVYLTEAVLQGDRVVLQPVSKILCICPLKHLILLPGSVGAITENHHWHLWSYQDFLTSPGSKQRSEFKETKCLHQCAITSFDVCLSLKIFVTGDTNGSVRIWDFHGKLITELDSALHFGPLCFANNRGDLLLTFNQSLYLVSCLKLLPPAQLIHLTLLNNADDIQEAPKPFLPSFFFSFEKVFVPKFVYFGQGSQELQGLEALVNKRMIAFDHTVPHVVEEERPKSSVMQEGPTLHFLEDKYTDFPTLTPKRDRPPFMVPSQLRLAGWDGLRPYQILHHFFGQGRPWPFPPDGYIPNSVIRARLWPEGTPIFLHCDLHLSYQDKDWDMTGLSRSQALSPVTSIKQKISKRKPDQKPMLGKQTFFDILVNLASQNWMGRKLDEGLINTLIETILNLTVYCSIEQYKTYISILAQIFASHQVSPRWHSETACRLMEDTTHSNPEVRETAWEGLEKLGFMSRLFAIPLAVGLMDSDKNVRAKALYLMVRVTGIQTKSLLIALLKRRDTLKEMQQDFIGEISLDQLLGIQASGIQYLLTQVEQRLNENLTLSHREEKPPLVLVISRDHEPEVPDEQTLKIWSEPAKIAKPKQRMTHVVTAKSKNLIKKDMKVPRKQGETELSPVLVTLEHEDEQREAKESDQIDIQDVASEPDLSLSTFSPVTSKEDAESKEVVLEATEVTEPTKALEIKKAVKAREAVEAMGVMKAIDQQDMRDYGKVIPKVQRQENLKRLWERAMKKSHNKVSVKLKEKRKLKVIPETTAEEPKKEVIQVAEQEEDATKVFRKGGRGLSGMPGRTTKSEARSWRDDICNLVTSRIASSDPRMLRDLSQELVNWAQAILAPQEPSWDLFQEICPLLKDSSELDDMEMEETPVVTEVVTEVVKEEKTVGPGEQEEQRAKKMLKKRKVSSKVKKKKLVYLDDDKVSDKMRFQKVKTLAMQKGKITGEARKLSKQDLKLMQGKEKLTEDKKPILQKEKRGEEEEISPISQKKLTKAEQKLVQREKKVTGKEEELLGKGKRMNWKGGKVTPGQRTWYWEKVTLDHKEGRQAQEEGLPVWEERKLLHEEEELMEEEEELMEEEEELSEEDGELSEEDEELSEEDEELRKELEVLGEEMEKLIEALEELNEELGELGEEEEELAQEKEEIIQHLEKQIEKMMKNYRKIKKHMGEMEKHDEEEAWERGKLAQEEEHLSKVEERLSGKKGKQTLKRHSSVNREMKLIREKKKSFMIEKKEAHKEKQIQEKEKPVEKLEKIDEKERQAKEKEEDAKDKQLVRKRQKLGQKEEELFGEKEKLSQQEARALEKRLTQKNSILGKEERHIAEKERAIAREGTGVTKRKKKATQEEKEFLEGKLACDIRAKEMGVAKEEKKRIQEESIQEMRKLDMGVGISSEGRETSSREKDIRKKESHLMQILAKIIREMSIVPLKETGIPEEDQLVSMEMSETDGQRWEFSKELEEITREEKQLVQKERKLEDDRLATEQRILTDEESLEEDQRLLEKVQENILLDKTQVDSMLKEAQQQNLLGKKQLKKLLKIIKEKKPEKTVSPLKTPFPVALGKEKGMLLKVLGHHFDLEGQESQLLKAHPMTMSWGRREDVLLEKGKGMFLQVMGMETQTPKGLHKPKSRLPEIIRESQKPKHRTRDGMWKWFLKSQDSQKGKTQGQAPAPTPTPTPGPSPALYPPLTSMPAKRLDSPDGDWISNALIRLEAGEQLSRDSFHRLSQLLKHLTSKGYLKQTHLYSLKAVAKRLQQNLQVGHRDISRRYKDALSPVYIKAIPPIRRKEMESWGESFPIHEPARPIPTPALPSMTYRVQDPKALTWLLLGKPYRSAQAQQLSHVLQEMGMQHFHPATRDIFTGAHASVEKQTLALMFQNDLRALKGEGRALKLPQLEKKAQSVSKDKEELPQWETFVALYHVLRMLQKRYARDSAAWMEQFKRLMDLYQLKSPRIQRLLLELLQRKRLQPQQTIYEEAARIKELVPGERLLCDLMCGSSYAPAGPLEFKNVVPLPGQNRVHTIQPTGIAQYGFLELAWKRLPKANPYRRERLPNIPTPTL